MFQVEVFWVVTLCNVVVVYQILEIHAASIFKITIHKVMTWDIFSVYILETSVIGLDTTQNPFNTNLVI
jgi:hypothetical protein